MNISRDKIVVNVGDSRLTKDNDIFEFNSLDSDKDGIISYKKIKLSNVDTEKLISLAPILYEIQYKGLELDFQAFYEKIKNLN